MIERKTALAFLEKKVDNKNIIKHMLATEALMGGIWDALKKKKTSNLGGTKEEWMMAGLLHDGDYVPEVDMNKQGVLVSQWLKEEGHDIPDNVAYAMAAHNAETGVKPKSLMDWTIFIGDSLTGLIVAAALVIPSKKLADVSSDSVLRRFKEKAFARGTRREDIGLCKEKLGIELEEFVMISLKSMQNISKSLGL